MRLLSADLPDWGQPQSFTIDLRRILRADHFLLQMNPGRQGYKAR
jgi:hypothetical protein